jgi:3-oxochol-4-en-24-oyl-CoA dehydrogenase
MAIGISDAHVELAAAARGFLQGEKVHEAGRAALDEPTEQLPAFWGGLAELGWLGLHVPEAYGGAGSGLLELMVVVEELGYATAPGPFLPTVLTSATIAARGDDAQRARWLPGLVDGTLPGALALATGVTRGAGGRLAGEVVVLGGHLAGLLALVVDDDVVLVEPGAVGVEIRPAPSLDPTRRSAVVTLRDVPVADGLVLVGAASHALALARSLVSADAVGGARRCVEMATTYAKERIQFGRPIAMFQAVKHLCANMFVDAETATATVWEAGRAAGAGDQGQFELAAAIAAARAVPAFVHDAERNIQVHGGIGFTWEHDGHVLLRRAISLAAAVDASRAAGEVAGLTLDGVTRTHGMELPAEAERYRAGARAMAEELAALDGTALRTRFIDSGYVAPHWPKPWGREAPALEQLVIDEEFLRAGVRRPDYGITGWIILTLIQHGSADQIERWVRPTLQGDLVWCQLFSEPDAGSDAAGIRTRAERVDGGWLITGQKVWTSGAQFSHRGLATVRTDPSKPKHAGISVVVIDMHAEGVEVRPLREATGNTMFNEVFFDQVFVADDDVVGTVDNGWTVARATLGNERVSIGGGSGAGPVVDFVAIYRRHTSDDAVLARELGMLVAEHQALQAMNLRRVERAVTGSGPGPEGNVTKLVAAEHSQRAADFSRRIVGPLAAVMEGDGAVAGLPMLFTRALTIAGGTSEITRNQIGERILGLPRDPLIT